MKRKKILIIVLVFSILFISCFYLTSSLVSRQYNTSYYNLIVSTINNINVAIERLDHSNNLYDTLISLTEIKQNSRLAVTLISNREQKNNEFAIGDLFGYIYIYLNDIKSEEINEQLFVSIANDLAEINTIFSRVNTNFIQDQDEYFKFLVRELDAIIDSYPENEILNLYSNRKMP